jgi:thiamine-phosphate pyrophosphorylase
MHESANVAIPCIFGADVSMPYNFTAASLRALEAARGWAAHVGSLTVLPEHLLYGLLDEEDGRVAELLTSAGLDRAAFQHDLGLLAGARPADSESVASLSQLLETVLGRAHELAVELAPDRTVATEQLLTALLESDADVCRRLNAWKVAVPDLVVKLAVPANPPLPLDDPLDLVGSHSEFDTARILDASANRAREAIRVIEDFCRYVLDDSYLTGRLKQERHDLVEALRFLPADLHLAARDTLGDVGTGLAADGEMERASSIDVVRVNFKRWQEAMRSLEEYSKIFSPSGAHRLEQIRYQSYTLERAVVIGAGSRQRLSDARLYVLLTTSECSAALDWTIKEATAGGAQVFQLREKGLPDRLLLEKARQVRGWTRQEGVLFIMNDRPDIARLVEADGVHVGQEELPVRECRRVLGRDALVGVSTHSLEQARRAVLDGASYIGVGPTFPSATKEFSEFPGLEFVRQVAAETSLPAFAIGGISLENIEHVVAAGVRRVAVSRAICQDAEPRQIAAELRKKLDQG